MRSLYELALRIEEDAERVRDRNRLLRDLQEYGALRSELDDLEAQVRAVIDSAPVVRSAVPTFVLKPPPATAIVALGEMSADGATLIDAPAAKTKSAVNDLRRWAADSAGALKESYQAWFDSVFGDLQGADNFARELGQIDPSGGIRIQSLVSTARARRHTLPRSVEATEELRQLARELQEATQAFAPTDETRDFVRAVLEGGAPLDLLTGEVQAWVQERGLWPSLRVRLGGDTGA